MKPFLFIFLLQCFRTLASPADTVRQIDEIMTTLSAQGEFNGSILVGHQGRILYAKGFGMANVKRNEKFTPGTVSNIASVTKQFTATGIMMLAEQNKLAYDDPITKYLSKLPSCYKKVSIRQLLTHTSGVFDYDLLGSGSPDKLIAKKNSLRFEPGDKYEYSNSNYVLLSLIIEEITKMNFPTFLQQKIFEPTGLTNTFTNVMDVQSKSMLAVGYFAFGKIDTPDSPAIFGDGGVWSTVEDLFKWDQALYTDRLVKSSTLAEAFRPGVVKTGTSTYGFGWNITQNDHGEKAIWHTGNTGGFRAFIQRRPADKITIIMLTNMGHSRRQEIAESIHNILKGRPYEVPKRSLAKKMYSIVLKEGIANALKFFDSLKQSGRGDYDFAEGEFNSMGYVLLYDDRNTDAAIKIFKLNTIHFPTSSNAFDSLGEAYLKNEDTPKAHECYTKALALDPANQSAANALKKMKGRP